MDELSEGEISLSFHPQIDIENIEMRTASLALPDFYMDDFWGKNLGKRDIRRYDEDCRRSILSSSFLPSHDDIRYVYDWLHSTVISLSVSGVEIPVSEGLASINEHGDQL